MGKRTAKSIHLVWVGIVLAAVVGTIESINLHAVVAQVWNVKRVVCWIKVHLMRENMGWARGLVEISLNLKLEESNTTYYFYEPQIDAASMAVHSLSQRVVMRMSWP